MNLVAFTVGSFVVYFLVIGFLWSRYRDHRDYWYAFIGITLMSPIEWIPCAYIFFCNYNTDFVMAFDNWPIWMPTAYVWFYFIPLLICLRLKDKIDSVPLFWRVIMLYSIFWIWDFWVEYPATTIGHWTLGWNPESMIDGRLPWVTPTATAIGNVMVYFAHSIALKYSTPVKEWGKGFRIHLLAYVTGWTLLMGFEIPMAKLLNLPW